MSYTIYFYAMDPDAFARRMADSADTLLTEVHQQMIGSRHCANSDLTPVLEAAKRICARSLPDDCDASYFLALCWLASVAAEPVPIGMFDSIKLPYLEAIGIWPWMRQHEPPFAIPRSKQTPPEVGYLSAESIRDVALPGFENLPKVDNKAVLHGRNEFREVLESLADDKLALLAVLF